MPNYILYKNGKQINKVLATDPSFINQDYDNYEKAVVNLANFEVADPIVKKDIDINDIRSQLTLAEKTIWDNDSEPEIVTAKKEFASPLDKTNATEVLDFLVQANIFSQSSVDDILSLIEV